MKLYRCFIGFLLVFFITIAVLYITSIYNEQRSVKEGILVSAQKEWMRECFYNPSESAKGGEDIATGHCIC